MKNLRPIHPDFQYLLDFKDQEVIELFSDLRQYILYVADLHKPFELGF